MTRLLLVLTMGLFVLTGCGRQSSEPGSDESFGRASIDGYGSEEESLEVEPTMSERIERSDRWSDREKDILQTIVGWFD